MKRVIATVTFVETAKGVETHYDIGFCTAKQFQWIINNIPNPWKALKRKRRKKKGKKK